MNNPWKGIKFFSQIIIISKDNKRNSWTTQKYIAIFNIYNIIYNQINNIYY